MKNFKLLLIVTGILIVTVTQAQVINLNNTVKTTAKNAIPAEFLKEAKNARIFAINPALQSAQKVKIGDKVALQLFENQDYMATVSNVTTDVNGTLALTLKFPEYPLGFAIISTSKEGKSLVNISIPELAQTFGSLYNAKANEYYMIEVDKNKRRPLLLDNDIVTMPKMIEAPGSAPQLRKTQAANCGPLVYENPGDPATIRVLVVYTPAAETSSYTTLRGGINTVISNMIALGNLCMSNSQTGITLELAQSARVTYTEDLHLGTSLDRLENPTDGYMDEVYALRKQSSADLVQLLSIDSDNGGLGNLLTNTKGDINACFSVCFVTQVGDNYPCSVHEMGHNMGLGHGAQMINKGQGIFSYSYGWRWTGTTAMNMGGINTTMKGSVMTYWNKENYADGIPCYNVPYFSNPTISFEGNPTGDATQADAARSLREMKHVIAYYKNRLPNLLDAPTNVVVSNPTANGATVTWDAVPNATSYSLSFLYNGGWWTYSPISTNRFTLNSSTYFQSCSPQQIYISAVNDCGDATRGPIINFKTACATDPTVTTLAATNITGNSATLNKTVTANGAAIISEGFMYKEMSAANWQTSSDGNLTGLMASTQYKFYAFATTASGTYNGSVLTFTTAACDAADQVNYTIAMRDAYGDGWNGSSLKIRQNGVDIKSVTLLNNSTGQDNVSLCTCMPFELIWIMGGNQWAYECSFTVIDNNGTQIFATPPGSTTSSTAAGCAGYTDNQIVFSTTTACNNVRTWTPLASSTVWNDANNWDPQKIPTASDSVIIPQRTSYPILKSADNAKVNSIHFAPGAELGHQELLTYNKAFVQLDFSKESTRDRWWMLTSPLQQLFAGDFSFGGLPGMDFKAFAKGSNGKTAWVSFSEGIKKEFGAGDNFEIWLSKTDLDISNSSIIKGLNASNPKGIITLPYFEDPSEKDVHYTQIYTDNNDGTGTSTFYGKTNTFERTNNSVASVTRNLSKAYKLADLDVNHEFKKSFDFVPGLQGQACYAAMGNPFMSSINFNQLQIDNNFISDSYWIWVGPGAESGGGYACYNSTAGLAGNIVVLGLDQYISPMQSFIVEIQTQTATTKDITFNIDNINATGQNANAGLRAAAQSKDLLEIIASTPQSAVRAAIASRKDGSTIFNRKDAHKLFAGINDLPDIYLLKPDANSNMVAVGADIVNEIKEDIVIPLGISTTYAGSITLSFAGMDTYNARVFLIDNAAPDKKEIELTGKTKYEYTFDYLPEKVNGTAVSNESRFSIRLSPTNVTGVESVTPSNIWVYSRSAGTIQAVSGELIQQVTVFNIQGQKIYDNASVNSCEYIVTGLAANVYVAKIVTKNEVKTVKIVVR